MKSLFKVTGIKRQVLIALCPFLGQVVAGYTVSWTGPIFLKLRDLDQSPLTYVPTELQISLVASLIYVGGIPGPYVTGWLSNIKGRRLAIVIGGSFSCLTYIILVWANSLGMLYLGRYLSGIGSGITTVSNLVYIGEMASSSIRGILLTGLGIFTTIGLLVVYCTGPFLSYRNATSIGLALSIAFTISALFLPESPFFYVLVDDKEKVKETLEDLGREEEIDKLIASKEDYVSRSNKKDWIELFTLKSNRRALLIAVAVNIFQHCSGFFSVLSFSGSIFEMAGSSISSAVAMIIVGLFQLAGSTTASFLIERMGRKYLLLISSIICCISMLFLGFYFYLDEIKYSGIIYVKWLPLVLVVLFFIGYDIGLGVVPNVLVGELFTINVRSKGSAAAISCSWVIGFGIMTAYGAVTDVLGVYIAFWFFSVSCFVCCFFTIFFVPETKGKTLLEVQDILARK